MGLQTIPTMKTTTAISDAKPPMGRAVEGRTTSGALTVRDLRKAIVTLTYESLCRQLSLKPTHIPFSELVRLLTLFDERLPIPRSPRRPITDGAIAGIVHKNYACHGRPEKRAPRQDNDLPAEEPLRVDCVC